MLKSIKCTSSPKANHIFPSLTVQPSVLQKHRKKTELGSATSTLATYTDAGKTKRTCDSGHKTHRGNNPRHLLHNTLASSLAFSFMTATETSTIREPVQHAFIFSY